jgi:hypothetical protein
MLSCDSINVSALETTSANKVDEGDERRKKGKGMML